MTQPAKPIVHGGLPVGAPQRRPAPAWVRQDWPLALAMTALIAVAVTAVCVAYGMTLGVLGAGSDGVLPGAFLGALLPFAAFGGEVSLFSGNGDSSIVLLLDQVPLVLTALAALISGVALRPGVARLAAEPPRARAFVAKVALLSGLLLLGAGGFTDHGGARTFEGAAGRATLDGVSQATAALGAVLVVGGVGVVLLERAGARVWPPLPLDLRRALLAARAGAAAYVVVLLAAGLGGLLVLGAHAQGARDRVAVVATAPLTLSGLGVTGSAVAHGGAAGSTEVLAGLQASVGRLEVVDPTDPRGLGRADLNADDVYRDALRLSAIRSASLAHVSLHDWELPLTDEQGTAPWWAFGSLLLPLVALAGGTLLLLRRASPPTEGWALRLGLMLGLGYAVAGAALAGLSPLAVSGGGSALEASNVGLLLVPALGSSLGLPMLWGAVVPALTALVWARRRGLPGDVFAGLGALPAPVPTGVLCPGCGTGAEPTDAYCAACGRQLRPPDDYPGAAKVVD